MKDITRIIAYMLAGALAFWTPDVLLHVRRGYELEGHDSLLLAVLLPWTLFSIYRVLLSVRGKHQGGPSMAAYMLLGVWMLGSLAMMIGATYSGGGFAMPGKEVWILIAMGLLPPDTFIMSAYDGSLLGLLAATVLIGLMHLKFEKGCWIIPPGIFKRVKKLLLPSPLR